MGLTEKCGTANHAANTKAVGSNDRLHVPTDVAKKISHRRECKQAKALSAANTNLSSASEEKSKLPEKRAKLYADLDKGLSNYYVNHEKYVTKDRDSLSAYLVFSEKSVRLLEGKQSKIALKELLDAVRGLHTKRSDLSRILKAALSGIDDLDKKEVELDKKISKYEGLLKPAPASLSNRLPEECQADSQHSRDESRVESTIKSDKKSDTPFTLSETETVVTLQEDALCNSSSTNTNPFAGYMDDEGEGQPKAGADLAVQNEAIHRSIASKASVKHVVKDAAEPNGSISVRQPETAVPVRGAEGGTLVSAAELMLFVDALNNYYLNVKMPGVPSPDYSKRHAKRIKEAFAKYPDVEKVFKLEVADGYSRVGLQEEESFAYEDVKRAKHCLHEGHGAGGSYEKAFEKAKISFDGLGRDLYGSNEKFVEKVVREQYNFGAALTQGNAAVTVKREAYKPLLNALEAGSDGRQPKLEKTACEALVKHYQHLENLERPIREDLKKITHELVPSTGVDSFFYKFMAFVGRKSSDREVTKSLGRFESGVEELGTGVSNAAAKVLKRFNENYSAEKVSNHLTSKIESQLGEIRNYIIKVRPEEACTFANELSEENKGVIHELAVEKHTDAVAELVTRYFNAYESALSDGVNRLDINQLSANTKPEQFLRHVGMLHESLNVVLEGLGAELRGLEHSADVSSELIDKHLKALKEKISLQIDRKLDANYKEAFDHWLTEINKVGTASRMSTRIEGMAKQLPALLQQLQALKVSGRLTATQRKHLSNFVEQLKNQRSVAVLEKPGVPDTLLKGLEQMVSTKTGKIVTGVAVAGSVLAAIGALALSAVAGFVLIPVALLVWGAVAGAMGWSNRQAAVADMVVIQSTHQKILEMANEWPE